MDYRKSHLHPEKGASYHAAFSKNPYRNMVWQFEKDILDRILKLFYRNSQICHFDFACGTGRILSYLENKTKCSVGVDLSPSMLEVARKNNKQSEIIEADLTHNDVLGDRKFNLITAFRFFPNAEDELRMVGMQVLTRHLNDNGYIVFNNHMNNGSAKYRLARLFGREGLKGMSIAEVTDLLSKSKLEIVKVFHLCVFPVSERYMIFPPILLRHIERFLADIPALRSLAENLVFVCKFANSISARNVFDENTQE